MHTEKKVKWAIFCSGWGRTALTLIRLFEENQFPNMVLDSIVCTGQQSPLVDPPYKNSYHIINEDPKDYNSRVNWQKSLGDKLKTREIDFIFLCGFKYRIHHPLLNEFKERIINIHPSLLPAFKNTQNAIQEAINLGVKVTGITTHIIDENIDEGIILEQKPINIEGLNFKEIDERFQNSCPEIIKATIKKLSVSLLVFWAWLNKLNILLLDTSEIVYNTYI